MMPKASAVAIRTVVVGLKLLELGTAGQKPGAETEQGGDYAVPDSVDCASELEPIVEVAKFKSEVEQAVSQVLMPRHDGIRIEKITSPAAAGAGYLIMQVERSDRRPHRNEAGEKQYFKRVGDSNIAMEHYDIEDSFKRFVVPSLDVEFALYNAGRPPGGEFVMMRISLILKNRSQVSARYPYLIIDNMSPQLSPFLGGGDPFFRGGANDVIHPDLTLFAMDLQCLIRVAKWHPEGYGYIAKGAHGSTGWTNAGQQAYAGLASGTPIPAAGPAGAAPSRDVPCPYRHRTKRNHGLSNQAPAGKTHQRATGGGRFYFLAMMYSVLVAPMTIEFRCGCLNSRPTSGVLHITEDEIAKALPLMRG
jgi:hypothetical protein